jgi:hypothetical protein
MIRHIVLVTFKPEASDDAREAWHAAVTAMCEASPEVISHTLGKNIGSGPNHHDAALIADFPDLDAFRRYIGSDAHKAYVEDHGKHVTGRLAAVQHEL